MLLSAFRLKSGRKDFETHLLYIQLLNKFSSGVKVNGTFTPKLCKKDLGVLGDKIKLIKLTKTSIDDEAKIVAIDKEYSTASVLWLPIKTYYLVFHLLCIIDCLLSGKTSSLSETHSDTVNNFTKRLKKGELSFSHPALNDVFDTSILTFVTKPGTHFKLGVSDGTIHKLLMKKITKEKIANYKIVNDLSAHRLKDKLRIRKFESGLNVSVFDFFYLMRLRVNYRNPNFIEDIPSKDTKIYFEAYYESARNFYDALSKYADTLIKIVK